MKHLTRLMRAIVCGGVVCTCTKIHVYMYIIYHISSFSSIESPKVSLYMCTCTHACMYVCMYVIQCHVCTMCTHTYPGTYLYTCTCTTDYSCTVHYIIKFDYIFAQQSACLVETPIITTTARYPSKRDCSYILYLFCLFVWVSCLISRLTDALNIL